MLKSLRTLEMGSKMRQVSAEQRTLKEFVPCLGNVEEWETKKVKRMLKQRKFPTADLSVRARLFPGLVRRIQLLDGLSQFSHQPDALLRQWRLPSGHQEDRLVPIRKIIHKPRSTAALFTD